MIKTYTWNDSKNYAENTKLALLGLPGIADRVEEGLPTGVLTLEYHGIPIYIKNLSSSAGIGFYKNFTNNANEMIEINFGYTLRAATIFYTEKYIMFFGVETYMFHGGICRTEKGIMGINKDYIHTKNDLKIKYVYVQNLAVSLFGTNTFNKVYKFPFFEMIENNLITNKVFHENFAIFVGDSTIAVNNVFNIGAEPWSCIMKSGNIMLGLKRV